MADIFCEAFNEPLFKLSEPKKKTILHCINHADELCGYINKFLPHNFTTNHGKNSHDEEYLEEKELKEIQDVLPTSESKTSRAKTIEELHRRIETMKGKRVSYKEKLIKKGLKKRLKKKQKLEERKQLKNNFKKMEKQDPIHSIPEANVLKDSSEVSKTPIQNDIKFNKFVMSQSPNIKKREGDPKSLLVRLEKKQQKLKKLETKGKKEKVKEIECKETWDNTIKRLEGVKVKDNIDLLKKSVAKMKNRKNKSKKKWEEREKQLKSKKEETQKKREENINKKRKERLKKKTKVLIKKGRILPK